MPMVILLEGSASEENLNFGNQSEQFCCVMLALRKSSFQGATIRLIVNINITMLELSSTEIESE